MSTDSQLRTSSVSPSLIVVTVFLTEYFLDLLEQDSEMQRIMGGLDSYDDRQPGEKDGVMIFFYMSLLSEQHLSMASLFLAKIIQCNSLQQRPAGTALHLSPP
jgi:hypothetical protein